MMKYILLIYIFLLGWRINAQNLVPNPSFEVATCTGIVLDTSTTIYPAVYDWFNGTNSGSYSLNTCTNTVPNGLNFGYQFPRTGNGYAGIGLSWFFNSNTTADSIDFRHYIQAKLLQPLQAGCTYDVTFYVNLADSAFGYDIFGIDAIGAYFSPTRPTNYSPNPTLAQILLTPQVINPAGNVIVDHINWVQISGSFTAAGGEEYITIGNFNTRANTVYENMPSNYTSTFTSAFYFLDDVSVIPQVPPGYSLDLGNDTTICNSNPFSITLTAQSSFNNYLWSTGATSQSITVIAPGDYWVDANFGCGVLRDTLTVSTQASVEQMYSLGPDSTICSATNLPITLNAPAGFNNYLWSNNATTSSTTVTPPGIIWVQSNYACGIVSDSLFIAWYDTGSFSIGNDTTLCSNSPVILDAGAGFDHYLWSAGSTIQTQQITQPGIYSVIVTIDHGCALYDTLIALNNFPPVINFADSIIVCKEDNFQLNVTAGNVNTTYLWSTGATTTAISVPASGTYSVTAINECGTASDSIYITLNECNGDPFVPSGFSPNGDGQNDVLLVRGNNIREMHLMVYDRWGGLMFESHDQESGWDGTLKGQALNSATFVYALKATLETGATVEKKGNISLVR